MKKYLLIILIGIFLTQYHNANASSLSIVGDNINSITATASSDIIDVAPDNTHNWCLFDDGVSLGCSSLSDFDGNNPMTFDAQNDWGVTNLNIDVAVIITPEPDCQVGQTLSTCSSAGNFLFSSHLTAPVAPVLGGMLANANSALESSIGVTAQEATSWTASNLTLFILGSGLGLLEYLAPWIIAILTIGIVVQFFFMAYRSYISDKR